MKPVKVSQINRYIKQTLVSDPILTNISVIGEISNIKYHGSGHVYFSLKDERSKISCFLPGDMLSMTDELPDDGMEVIVSGYVSVYERGGSYSINVRDIEVITESGDLAAEFERLKKKLKKEGLFDEGHKKKIPYFPHKVAVVTSETGAAVKDIIKIIRSRNDLVDIFVYPVLVQGPLAPKEISDAINDINIRFPDTDVIITGRGGGSAEELWAFNEEIVARAIYASDIPIISAVGHETDFTISDFVADRRAETPTAAAVMAVPDTVELRQYIVSLKEELLRSLKQKIVNREHLLSAYSLQSMLTILKNRVYMSEIKLDSSYKQLYDLSPYNIIDRGYAAILDENGMIIKSASDIKQNDKFTALLKDGKIKATVSEITLNGPKPLQGDR